MSTMVSNAHKFQSAALAFALVFAMVAPAAQPDLAIKVEPVKAVVAPGDPIALRLTFRNESANAFRLPHTVSPPTYQLWVLKLRDEKTGKMFTGVSALPMGAAPRAGAVQPQLLAPRAAIVASVSFEGFVILEGDLNFEGARNQYFPQRLKPRGEFALPTGTYAVRVIVRFLEYPNSPARPVLPEYQAAITAIENDPVPLWKGREPWSDETRIVVRSAGP